MFNLAPGAAVHPAQTRVLRSGCAAVTFAFMACSAHAALGNGAWVSVSPSAYAGSNGQMEPFTDAWERGSSPGYTSLRADKGVAVQDGTSDPHGVTSASSSASVFADWTYGDATAGTVDLHTGWALDARDKLAWTHLDGGGPFTYSFDADAGETLKLTYQHSGSTLLGWDIRVVDASANIWSVNAAALRTGSASFTLQAGTYSLELRPVTAGDVIATPGQYLQDSTDAHFSWAVSSVPEPATTALWLGGLAGLGLALRRRQR